MMQSQEQPYNERKYLSQYLTLADAAIGHVVLTPPANTLLTIERISYDSSSFTVAGSGCTIGVFVAAAPPAAIVPATPGLLWLHDSVCVSDPAGVLIVPTIYENDELNLTIEGGRPIYISILNNAGDPAVFRVLVVYRTELRGAPGVTHG